MPAAGFTAERKGENMQRPRILIVEDEPAIAETIRYALETDGCDVVDLRTGSPVTSLLNKERMDLIILDIGLPDINGFELCKRIRQDCNVPIIFLTARSEEIDRVVGLEIGADDYVVKPFSPRELAARVKAVLRRTAGPRSDKRSERTFEVDNARRSILYYGTALALSRYEFDLLVAFLEQPGRVFSREQLMQRVWEEPDASLERTVDAHIKNIRAKLRKVEPETDPILTHRGIGYSLKEFHED